MINDAQIRQLMIRAVPSLVPSKLEVCMVDYDAAVEYRYHGPDIIDVGRTIAINRTETEIAAALAADLSSRLIVEVLATTDISPYEGKRGKHPKSCTCSKHLRANGQAQ